MWRCPHCGAPQAETARCWVCRRSSTTCSTCRHFQTALGTDGGWCALDAKRLPLTGLEQRGCWQARRAAIPASAADTGVPNAAPPQTLASSKANASWARAGIDFIPVELLAPRPGAVETAPTEGPPTEGPTTEGATTDSALPPSISAVMPEREEAWVERTSLFGELEA
jgi:hypothetical protein